MGYGVLHQPNASRRIGAIFARSKNSGCCGEKIGVVECGLVWDVRRVLSDLLYLKIRRGTQAAQGRGLQNLHSWVRIPPAPPSFSFQINGLQLSSVSRNPRFGNIWEQLGKESLPDSRLNADVYPESHACRSSAWSRQKRAPTAAARSWRVRRCRAGPKHECDAVDATSRAQALLPLPPASTRVPEDYSRGAVRPIGSGRVSLPRSIWRRTSCDAHPRVRVSVDRLGWCEYYARS